MGSLGYLYEGLGDAVPVADGGRTLYHLTFFSRHQLGRKFWIEAKRHSTDQLDLFPSQ
jgi:hypothetical protein